MVPAERLVELVWGEAAPETASNVLQVHISQLRRVLEPARLKKDPYSVLISQAPGYRLQVEPESIDLFRFQAFWLGPETRPQRRRLEASPALTKAGLTTVFLKSVS